MKEPDAPGGALAGGADASPRLSRRIVGALSVTSLGSLLTMAASTLAGVAVARAGGPAGFASFAAVNMLVFVTAAGCEFGLGLALSKYAAREEEQGRHHNVRRATTNVLLAMLALGLVPGLAVATHIPTLSAYLQVDLAPALAWAFVPTLALTLASYTATGLYSGLLRPDKVLVITLSGPVCMIAYVLARRLGWPLPLWGAVAASYGVSGLVALGMLLRERALGVPFSWREWSGIRREVAGALAFVFLTIFSAWSDRWIVGTQLGAVPLGLYAAAVAVLQAALRVPTNIAYVLVPAGAKVALGGADRSGRFNGEVVGAFAFFACLLGVVVLLGAPLILGVLFGYGFVPAANALRLMTPSLLAAAVTVPFMAALTGGAPEQRRRNRRAAGVLLATVPPRLVLLWLLTRQFGLAGTALAASLADCALAACCVALSRRLGMDFDAGRVLAPLRVALPALALGALLLRLGAPEWAALGAVALFMPHARRLAQTALAARRPVG